MVFTTRRIDAVRCRESLKDLLLHSMPEDGDYPAEFCAMTFYRRSHVDTEHVPIFYDPVAIFLAQGEKSVRVGKKEYIYGGGSYFITGIDMPTACAVRGVSPDCPFLSLALKLDRGLLAELTAGLPPMTGDTVSFPRGAMIGRLDGEMLDAVLRLAELTARTEHAPVLAPLTVREVHYRLLLGEFGPYLRAINAEGTPSNQIARTIIWLKEHFQQPASVMNLARMSNMAPSTFHKHFKEMTAMSPLRFQKRLRLEYARRAMLTQGLDASSAASAAGYESIQQFGRDYKRLFGNPPRRDIAGMRRRTGG